MKKTKHVSYALRALIHRRDDETCQYCGVRQPEYGNLIVEHIVPTRRQGPMIAPHNLVSACHSCNCLKCSNVWIPRNIDTITAGMDEWRERIISLADIEGQAFAMQYRKRKTRGGMREALRMDRQFIYSPRGFQVDMDWGQPVRVWRKYKNRDGKIKFRTIWAVGQPMDSQIRRAVNAATEALRRKRQADLETQKVGTWARERLIEAADGQTT